MRVCSLARGWESQPGHYRRKAECAVSLGLVWVKSVSWCISLYCFYIQYNRILAITTIKKVRGETIVSYLLVGQDDPLGKVLGGGSQAPVSVRFYAQKRFLSVGTHKTGQDTLSHS